MQLCGDIMMELQKELPQILWYITDRISCRKKEKDLMKWGFSFPLEHFSDRLERHIEKRIKIVYGK